MRVQSSKTIGLFAGPLLALVFWATGIPDPAHPEIGRMAGVALLMASWWLSDALPLAATALVPLVLFPVLGIMKGKEVAPHYFNSLIFLFVGGFIIALAMERWNLHKRIAMRIILAIGVRPGRLLLGFMVATWFLSMWISNTATTMMMVPIGLAVILKLEEDRDQRPESVPIQKEGTGYDPKKGLVERDGAVDDPVKEAAKKKGTGGEPAKGLATGLLLGIAYASSVGGIATLVGTPPNIVLVKILADTVPEAQTLSFGNWFMFAFPLSATLLAGTWGLLYMRYFRKKSQADIDIALFREEYRKLGSMSREERVVALVFVLVALLWLTRSDLNVGALTLPGWSRLLLIPGFIDDGTVAIAMALLLFIIPTRRGGYSRIVDAETIKKIPWNIVLLFGGGFALAAGFKASGLSEWIGHSLRGAAFFPPIVLVLLICLVMTFLTELTSNTATTQMILPILAAVAAAIHLDPLLLMVPATLSASCAFMLPVATPPNAIVFGTERMDIGAMARAGLKMNLMGVVLITLATFTLARFALHIPG